MDRGRGDIYWVSISEEITGVNRPSTEIVGDWQVPMNAYPAGAIGLFDRFLAVGGFRG